MHSPGINGEGELRGEPANPDSPGKMAVKTECVSVCCKCCHWREVVCEIYCILCVVFSEWLLITEFCPAGHLKMGLVTSRLFLNGNPTMLTGLNVAVMCCAHCFIFSFTCFCFFVWNNCCLCWLGHSNRLFKQDQILKTKVTRPRPPEVNKGTWRN